METTIRNVLIAAYLVFQLLLPIPGFLQDKYETRGNFSWNMYAYRYVCDYHYTYLTPDGETREIDPGRYFKIPSKVPMVLHRDALPQLHAWLCEETRREAETGSLRGSVGCVLNDDPRVEFVDPEADLCVAPGYGVLPE